MYNKLIVLTDEVYEEIICKLDALLENKTNQKENKPEWLTNEDVMKLLNVSKSTLQSYRDKQVLPFYQNERKILYKLKDIETYLETYKNFNSKFRK